MSLVPVGATLREDTNSVRSKTPIHQRLRSCYLSRRRVMIENLTYPRIPGRIVTVLAVNYLIRTERPDMVVPAMEFAFPNWRTA